MTANNPDPPLQLKFLGSLIEQLGAQMYPSATAAVAELISNAWDADAENVWVEIPLGTEWDESSEIIVVDDGLGMSREEAQSKYLLVGRKRREVESTANSPGGRKLHGRKGIGKLAAFGTSRILEFRSVREKQDTAFRLDYDRIRKLRPTEAYEVAPAQDSTPLVDGEGRPLLHGTRIRLQQLRLKQALNPARFGRSMARRFAIAESEMRVFINREPLRRFDHPVEFRFPVDAEPDGVSVDDEGWGMEELGNGETVRWWIGFTEKPLDDETLQGVSILANGKMAQRPFLFERSQGVSGQLGQEYLVGEVQADWLDTGFGIDDDLIQANRDQLQLEDIRIRPLLEWGQSRLAWALRKRNDLRAERTIGELEDEGFEELIAEYTPRERQRWSRIADSFSRLEGVRSEDVVSLVRQAIDAQADQAVRHLMEEIESTDPEAQSRIWGLVHEFSLIDARRNLSLIEARLETIRKVRRALESGAREVPEVHDVVKRNTWLLDPRWHLLGDEVELEALEINYEPEKDESGLRLDYMFAIGPSPPAAADEVVIVEIKRARSSSGEVRKATDTEVDKFHGYVLGAQEHFRKTESKLPRVRGLMIAEGYTARAESKRRSLEQLPGVELRFTSWNRVLEDTERLHTGWLALSETRARDRSTDPDSEG